MRNRIALLGSFCLLVLTACSSVEVIRPPVREADLYPDAEERSEIIVAVDVISDPGRVRRYFNAPLLESNILPIQVMISNRSANRIQVRPSDVLLMRGRRVVDPLPVQYVVRTALAEQVVSDDTADQVEDFFEKLSFRHTVVAPEGSYQGILFVPRNTPGRRGESRLFRVASLFLEPDLWLRMAATDLETDDRVLFGPFGLAP